MTIPAPNASDSGRLRLGFFTSAAGKGMLFQASAEKSEPTMATPISVTFPIVQVGWSGGYGCITQRPAFRQKSVKFAVRATSVENQNPSSTSAASDPTLATVNTF